MKRSILIAIILIVLLIVVWGMYAIFTNSGKNYNVQGVKVQIERDGTGNQAKAGDTVTLHYIGTLSNGQQFDSSYDRNAPITFTLGAQQVIQGFDLGITGMKVGEKRKITIPPNLAYGSTDFASIPANSTLTYEVELLSINQ